MAHMNEEQIRKLQKDIIADISSGAEQHSGQDSGTTQKKETAEEGFTNEDGSVVVSKKMTRVVTTTRTTLPDSPVESLGSVKDRIAKFEQFKTLPIDPSVSGPPPSIHALTQEDEEPEEHVESTQQYAHEEPTQSSEGRDSGRSGHTEQSIPEVHFTESDTEIEHHDDHHEESHLEPTVGIVITPHTPIPPEHPDDREEIEDEQPQEPLEPSEPEHVARAEIKDTREYSDEELAHELSPSEEHVSTAEIKDIKSYSPTSSDDERSSQKGKVSPPIPQVRHVISPSVASEVLSSHDDELAAHYVAESFEKHDEGRVETMEHQPVYRGHHSPGQTSPIVSEHPIAQEYAESVTSHDEGDNLSLKSGHEPEIARHSVASVQEEEEEKSGLGDFAKKAGMIVGGVIAAPVALAAVGAKAAYDALKKDDDDEEKDHEAQEVLTTQTTIMESPIQHEDIPPPHMEDVTPKVSHHEQPHEIVTETTTTVTREHYDEPEDAEVSSVKHSPVPSEKEQEPHLVSETTTTTTVTREFYNEPEQMHEEVQQESHSPAPTSHVQSERHQAGSPALSEQEHPHVVETTTTTTVTREYEEEEPEVEDRESIKELPHVTETTTTTTVTREYDQEEGGFDSERLSEPAHSPEPATVGTPAESEKSIPHVVETTTTTTVTREFYDEEDPEHRESSPVAHKSIHVVEEQREVSPSESPIPSERSVRSIQQHPESPAGERHSPVPSEPMSEKDAHHVTETTTTTTVTRDYFEEPQDVSHSPAPSSHVDSEHPISESPAFSEREVPHVVEITTTTTVTRDYEVAPEHDHPESSDQDIASHVEPTPSSIHEFQHEEYPRPESPAEVYPIPSNEEQELHLVSETTTRTTVTREFYDEPEHGQEHPDDSYSPAPSSHAESAHHVPESPVESEKEHPHVVETTTTTTVTREFHDEEFDRPESPSDVVHDARSSAPASEIAEHRDMESPAVSEKEVTHVVETTTTTTVTQEVYDDDFEKPESRLSEQEQKGFDSPASAAHEFYGDQPQQNMPESPHAQYFQEEQRVFEQHQPESGDESDGEGFGSKVLGFAKKAEMVAGGVVAAPVALAAVGAKAAYDALKKDDDEEEEDRSHEEPQDVSHSPAPSSHAGAEHPVPESPALSEKELPHVVETTTTTTVTREFYDEEQEHAELSQESHFQAPSSHAEPDRHLGGSSALSEQEHPHVIETSTTTTVTREFDEEPDTEQFEKSYEEKERSPSPTELQEHLVKESTTTTTVTREFYDEPEHGQEHPEESYSSAPSSHAESAHHVPESPVESEKEHPHVVETTTTTTVTREFHDEEFDRPESLSDVAHDARSSAPASEVAEHRDLESPALSEKEIPHVIETTTTTTTTREFYNEEAEPDFPQTASHGESPIAHHQEKDYDRAASPAKSEEGSEKHFPHVTETTTTTTVTREYDQEEEGFDSERLSEPAHSPEPATVGTPTESEKSIPHVVETTTTTTVTREFYDEEDPEHREASPVHSEEQFGGEHPVESTTSIRGSPVPSENVEDSHLVKETTTTTTVTREFYDEPEHGQEHPEESYSPAPSSHVESERHIPESPVASEKESQFVEENVEPRFEQTQQRTSVTQEDSPAAQYFHEQLEHQTESPVPTEKAPLLTEQHQPESGDESDGEGFGSKVLGFAKKAGMVAGGVVAAPVALAAVGAKAAYDALKKDDGEEETSYSQEHAQESPTASEKHHVTETTTTTTVTREYFDEPESHEEHGQESVAGSEHSIPHVVESTTTTTVKRDYDEEPISESPVPPEKESTTVSREVFETAQGNEPEHHYIETTTTTVQKEIYDEPEEAEDDGEPKQETPHVVETTTTTKTTREYEDDEEISESSAPHVTETTTTTTVVREFYGDQPEESEEPIDEPVSAQIDEEDAVSPDSDSTTSVSREIHTEEPHVVETTTTTVVTREYHDEPEETEESDVKETTTTTTLTREYYEDEPESPIKEHLEEDRASPVDSEKFVPQVMEATTATTVTRQFYDEEEPEFKQTELHGESPIAHHQEQNYDRAASPEKSEEESEKHFPDVTETTTTTTVTREYDQEEGGFDSERLSEPAHLPEPATVGTPTESEKSIPHVVETTTTTTVTREFYDEEDPEHREASPVHFEKQFGGEPPLESTTSLRGSPVPSETVEESHLVKKTTTTTTATREFFDEPEYGQEHPEESYSPASSSHVESERHIPESPVASEKESHFVQQDIEPRFEQTQQRTSLTQEDSPAAQYFHEQLEHQTESPVPTEKAPLLTEQHQSESGDESDGEGFGSKVLGFAKKAGMVAGGVVAAPVALAAVGAKAAYDALKKDDDEDDEEEQHALLGDVHEQHLSGSPVRSEAYHQFEQTEQRFEKSPEPSERSDGYIPETTTSHEEYHEPPTTDVASQQAYDQESLKSPVDSEKSFRQVVETTTTETREQFGFESPEQQRSGSASPSHKEEIMQFQGEHSSESSVKEREKETENEKDTRPELERQGSYSPGYSPNSPRGSLAESDGESRQALETVPSAIAEQHVKPEEQPAGSPVPSEESSTKFVETTTTTTVTREHFESEDEPTGEHVVESEHYPSGSPVPSEEDVRRVIETTTTTTVKREDYDDEQEPHHVVESREYSASGSPVSSEKSVGYTIETTTTTTGTREHVEHEDDFGSSPTEVERSSVPVESSSPVPSEEDVHGYMKTTTTTTTLTRELFEPENEPIGGHVVESEEYASGSPIPSEKSVGKTSETHEPEEHQYSTSPVQSEKQSEEPSIAPYEQPTEYGRVDSHDAPASPAPSAESPIRKEFDTTSPLATQEYSQPEGGFESERLSEPTQSPEPHAIHEKDREYDDPHFEQTQQRTSLTYEDSPAAQYFHEEPEHQTESPVPTEKAPLLTEQHQPESGDESDGEGFGRKVLGFAKKAGMVAGGVVAAPVALAAVGAKAAYDALKKDDDEDDEEEQHALLGDTQEQTSSQGHPKREDVLVSPKRRALINPVSDDDSQSEIEAEYTEPTGSDSEQSHRYTETIRKTTVTREYLDDDESQHSRSDSEHLPVESPSEQVVETTTTVIRHYHDEPQPEVEGEEKTLPEEVTVLREVYEAPEGDEPEHHYIETKTTTIITKEVYEPENEDAPASPIGSEKNASEKDFPIRDTRFDDDEPHAGDTTITTVTRELYEEPEGVRPASGSEADDESHAPRYLETTTTTTVTREYEVSDEETEGEESHPVVQQREGSPAPSEESVTHVVEKTTTTTVTEERFEQEEPSSAVPSEEDAPEYVKTTTTTTTVTHERLEPEDEPTGEHVVESEQYPSGSPVPSEEDAHRVIETTTTTTVTHEHYEPEEEHEILAAGSPVLSEKSAPSVTVVEQSSVHAERSSPVPSEEDVHGYMKTTTTTTTVTREHFEPEDEPTGEHVVESEEYSPASPIPSEQESSRVIETTTTTTVTHERYEPEEERHLVESRDYDAESGRNVSESPVASEKESHFIEEDIEPRFEQTQQRTSLTHEDSPAAQYFHEEPEHQTESPVPTEKAPLLTEQHQPESGDESDGEGFGSKVLGFAKKAGMVAGGVVAAPVALAAVGAKTAYDALKKDNDEDDDEEEKHALLGDSRERRAIDSETQEPGATFYEPEEEDKVISETAEASSPKQEEPKIVFPVDSPAEQYVRDKTVFESMVQAEGPYIIESEDYEPSTQQEQRVSSPVPSDSDEIQTTPQQEQQVEDEEAQRHQETSETDAPYIIDSEEYEFSNREEQRISSPVHSDEEERDDVQNDDVIETEAYGNDQQDDEVDPSIVESEEYLGSGQGSPRPFEDSTTTTVLSVHHEPPAIPEPEVDEEELGQDRSVIESGEYSSGSPLPPTTITTVEHVDPAEEHEYTPESPTTVTTVRSEHFEQHHDPSVVESEEYVKSSPIGHERPESPSGSPTHPDDYDNSHVIESQEYSGSPVPSEDSVKHVVEKTTTTTTTEEHFEPEDPSEDIQDYVKTTTTTTTVTREPEGEEHLVESHEYSASGSPVPSEKSVGHFIETTTTTTVTREHVEHEDHPSSHTGTEHFEQSSEQSESKSPVPSEEDVHGYMKTTTTTTTVTREHFDSEDEPTGDHVVESEEYASGSPIPSEQESSRVIETITTTTTTREHFEPEEEQDAHHVVESREYYSSGSPVPSERSVGHVIGTTSTTTVTREYVEPEGYEHSISGKQSPVHSEKSVEHVLETRSTTDESHSRFEPEEEKISSPKGEVHESMKTTSAITSESRYEPENFQKEEEEGDESDGEGFGSKVLGFAKKAGMVAGGVVAAPVALAAVGAKAAYDALKKDDDDEEHDQFRDQEHVQYDSAELHKQTPSIETHQEKDDSESEGSFVDHGEESQHLPLQSTEAAFKLSSEDVAEQTAEKLVSEVFSPLDRTLIESEQYRASIESLNRRSPVEPKRSVEDLASEALQNVTKISFGHADDSDDKHDDHDEEWKVYDRHGEILEEFSTQLTDDVIQEAEGDATTQIMMTQAEYSPRRSKFLKQESCQEISNEPEVDYYSDLQEKLNILAGEKNNLHALVEEEPSSSASDQLDVIHESDQEAHLEQEHEEEAAAQKEQEEKEEAAEYTATQLVDEVLQQVVHEIREEEDDQKTMTSDAYLTATEKDDQEYDTCVTSQDDTYESAQGWTSQDSEYTTATSQAPSRLSDSDGEHTARDRDQERQETSTPQAILSPVDSDRQFTVQQDFDMPVIRAFDPDDFMQTTARSTPDVALQVTIEEEDESDDKLPISPSGILLPPQHDPGRPISPVPPRKSDGTMKKEGDHFVFVREEDFTEPTPPPQLSEQTAADEARKLSEDTQITTETVPQEGEETEMRRQETERIHSLAMEASSDLGNSESSRYSRQLSDLSSSAESHADTVIRVESERSGSSDSLEVVSVISAGKDARTSEKSLTPEDPEKPLDVEQKSEGEEKEEHPGQEAEDLGFE
ncbi:hypothetical protein CRE_20102, partial [Caenorhabditis remanei]